jgi:hypothetical protein
LDAWSRGRKQSQTKPIFRDLPLPARPKTSLTLFLTRPYATTPQTQKQTQTNPISPLASLAPAKNRQRNFYEEVVQQAMETLKLLPVYFPMAVFTGKCLVFNQDVVPPKLLPTNARMPTKHADEMLLLDMTRPLQRYLKTATIIFRYGLRLHRISQV